MGVLERRGVYVFPAVSCGKVRYPLMKKGYYVISPLRGPGHQDYKRRIECLKEGTHSFRALEVFTESDVNTFSSCQDILLSVLTYI